MGGYRQDGRDGGATGIEATHFAELKGLQGGQRNGKVLHIIVR